MVKNKGGNRAKKCASKHQNAETRRLRLKQDSLELYGAVLKMFGGSRLQVICEDDVERICIIRNKFRGRNKRHNIIKPGVWVLVGKREYEQVSCTKIETVDLLHVYKDYEKDDIKKQSTENLSCLNKASIDNINNKSSDNDSFIFTDKKIDNNNINQDINNGINRVIEQDIDKELDKEIEQDLNKSVLEIDIDIDDI